MTRLLLGLALLALVTLWLGLALLLALDRWRERRALAEGRERLARHVLKRTTDDAEAWWP